MVNYKILAAIAFSLFGLIFAGLFGLIIGVLLSLAIFYFTSKEFEEGERNRSESRKEAKRIQEEEYNKELGRQQARSIMGAEQRRRKRLSRAERNMEDFENTFRGI